MNSSLKAYIKKALALTPDDLTTEQQYEAFLHARLDEMHDRLCDQRQLYSILPELQKAIDRVE